MSLLDQALRVQQRVHFWYPQVASPACFHLYQPKITLPFWKPIKRIEWKDNILISQDKTHISKTDNEQKFEIGRRDKSSFFLEKLRKQLHRDSQFENSISSTLVTTRRSPWIDYSSNSNLFIVVKFSSTYKL